MTPERYRQIDKIVDDALELTVEARTHFLDQACAGDGELRQQVERLLKAHEHEESFLAAPALEAAARELALSQEPSLIGQQFGHYQIRALLGAGGMGEVYQAEDLKLHRQVALKLLPVGTSSDSQARRRFLREARAASALNHPNIVTIHAIEEVAGRDLIVMEYVGGQTLKAELERGPLEFPRVLELGAQVVDAIATAHEAGLIHRDLKPANILLTPQGRAKVVDFGLAKKVTLSHDTESQPHSLTDAGMIVGTVAYMSPEQTRGEELDARSDIFSLGCVLYEAATGKRPFAGPSTLATMHEIATVEPPTPSTLNPALPRAFDTLIQRAMAKDKQQRYETAQALAAALRNLQASSASRQTGTVGPSRRLGALKLAVGALLIVATGLWLGWRSLTKSPATGRFQSSQSLPNTENTWRIALSPDGEYMVHAVKTRLANAPDEESLWLRQVATASDVQLVAPAQAHYIHLAFTPDGRHVYYSVQDQAQAGEQSANLYKIPALGGAAVKLVADTDGYFTLAPDGARLAFVRNSREESRLVLARADGSAEQVLAVRRRPNAFSRLAWSPNGQVIAAAATNLDASGKWADVVEVKVSNGAERNLVAMKWRNINGLAWLPDGSALMLARFWLWRIAYPSGAAERIPGDNNYYDEVSLSADGSTLASIAATLAGNIWVIANGDFESARPITGVTAPSVPRWTPDGGIVFQSGRSGNVEIWTVRIDGSGLKQLTVNEALDSEPVCSPDGRYVVFTSDRSGTTNIWRMDADGSHPQQLTSGKFDSRPEISPDGQWVLYTATEPEEMSLWRVPIAGGTAVHLGRTSYTRPAISPDGKLIACGYGEQQSNATAQVALIPFEGGEPIRVLNLPGSANSILRWTPDGRHLSYLNMLDGGSNLWLQPLDGGPPKQITQFKDRRVSGFDWSRDGKSLLCSRTINLSKVVLLKDVR